MKKIILFMSIVLLTANVSFSQDTSSPASLGNIIDTYFKSYNSEPEYRSTDITEEMMNKIREKGIWGNPKFDKFMRQIKLYKKLSFKSNKEHSEQIFAGVKAAIKKDRLYKPYFKWNKDSGQSYFYIKSNDNKITEFSFITIIPDRNIFTVSSFNGDNIDIETIRSFTHDK
jgi:hypothetical protein